MRYTARIRCVNSRLPASRQSWVVFCKRYIDAISLRPGVAVYITWTRGEDDLSTARSVATIRENGHTFTISCKRPARDLGLAPGDMIGIEIVGAVPVLNARAYPDKRWLAGLDASMCDIIPLPESSPEVPTADGP